MNATIEFHALVPGMRIFVVDENGKQSEHYFFEDKNGIIRFHNYQTYAVQKVEVEQKYVERVKGLALRMPKLQSVPEFIFSFPNLTALDLDLSMVELPSQIGLLTNLESLEIRSRQLEKFTNSLNCLTRLRRLILYVPKLEQIDSFPFLPYLQIFQWDSKKIGRNSIPLVLIANQNLEHSYIRADVAYEIQKAGYRLLGQNLGSFESDSDERCCFILSNDDHPHNSLTLGIFCCAAFRWQYIFRARFFEICLGLQSLDFPALVTYSILLELHEWTQVYQDDPPMHLVWQLITKIKHFQ